MACLTIYKKTLSINCAIFHYHYLRQMDFPGESLKFLLANVLREITVNDDNLPVAQNKTYYVLNSGSLLHTPNTLAER